MGRIPTVHWRIERKYKAQPEGQDVRVEVVRCPAEFFRIVVTEEDKPEGVTRPHPGFVMVTGSGMRKLAHAIAKAVSEGMLGVEEE